MYTGVTRVPNVIRGSQPGRKWPKIKVLRFANGLWDRLGLPERALKLASGWSGDRGKVEKIWIENRHAVTVFQGAGTIESENIDFWSKVKLF